MPPRAPSGNSRGLEDHAPEVAAALSRKLGLDVQFEQSAIVRTTEWVAMRDGVRLATDLYLPPCDTAPAIALRTPYGRRTPQRVNAFTTFARHGYAVMAQDCRGTGESEPDHWNYYVYEREDSVDSVEWVISQPWFSGFVGSIGSSYTGGTQWCMAMHPAMSAITPQVQGLGVAGTSRPRFHMFVNAYSRSVGNGAERGEVGHEALEREMVDETLAGGYFNEPLFDEFSEALVERYPALRSLAPTKARRWLYETYSELAPAQRAQLIRQALGGPNVTISHLEELPRVFGHAVAHDAHMLPRTDEAALMKSLRAPALMITGWYDWFLDDALATWDLLAREGRDSVASRSRLLITPHAHNMPGYHEDADSHAELTNTYTFTTTPELWLHWFAAVRGDKLEQWPRIIYYLMGANEWRYASTWPPVEAQPLALYLGTGGVLSTTAPTDQAEPARYLYDPEDPTPTVGGSIVSYVYTPGSADVSAVQERSDVLTYTSDVLHDDIDVAGPLRLILYASSSAVDTDFVARLSDVFPDGRAIQLQSGALRSRYRNQAGDPELLSSGVVYRFEIDMAATAARFRRGHRIRVDVSSADFPKFDRNTNRGGEFGAPLPARQSVYHDEEHPSCLMLFTISEGPVLESQGR